MMLIQNRRNVWQKILISILFGLVRLTKKNIFSEYLISLHVHSFQDDSFTSVYLTAKATCYYLKI